MRYKNCATALAMSLLLISATLSLAEQTVGLFIDSAEAYGS